MTPSETPKPRRLTPLEQAILFGELVRLMTPPKGSHSRELKMELIAHEPEDRRPSARDNPLYDVPTISVSDLPALRRALEDARAGEEGPVSTVDDFLLKQDLQYIIYPLVCEKQRLLGEKDDLRAKLRDLGFVDDRTEMRLSDWETRREPEQKQILNNNTYPEKYLDRRDERQPPLPLRDSSFFHEGLRRKECVSDPRIYFPSRSERADDGFSGRHRTTEPEMLPHLTYKEKINPLQISALDELDPSRYHSTQDAVVVREALKIVTDPEFVASEARAIFRTGGRFVDAAYTARRRYDLQTSRTIADAVAGVAEAHAFEHLSSGLKLKWEDSPAAQLEMVNRVNFCPAQVRGIIERGVVRDTYVDNVAERVERLMSTKGF